ncbi:integral membrane protein [Diaporthe eres]|uniref:Cytochrome b561 domain-containing protein n=2 Tax=Diaporthe vaccinii TaxID=105482 RepID=A0ABR4FBS2_9PEZI|nr:integral membrane protein [Diaporthe eres]
MVKLNLAGAVLATAALVTPSLAAQSTFIAPTQSVAFALSIPDDASNDDIYFSVAMARGLSWASIGMGGHKMPGSLMFMIYPSASGKNVTFSPRLATDHTEPEFYPSLDFETLSDANATGLMNETTYVYSAVCHNCRTWRGGSIDVNSTSQQFIFATGPGGDVGSDSDQASVRLHYEHGAFTMDMRHATGPTGPAVLNVATADDNEGSTLVGQPVEGMNDWVAVIHAVFMIGCFVGLMPLGILILRLGGWVRWHGLNQGVAMIGVIVGLGLGIKAGTLYNRTKNFNTAHQVIGIIVFIFILAQFTLGFMHHRVFKKTQQTTKFAPIHIWLGRAAIILGIVNAFLGFPLALSPRHNYTLLGLVIAISSVILILLSMKLVCMRRRQRREEERRNEGPTGYQAEPWMAPGLHQHSNAGSFEMGSLRKSGSTTVVEARPPPAYAG